MVSWARVWQYFLRIQLMQVIDDTLHFMQNECYYCTNVSQIKESPFFGTPRSSIFLSQAILTIANTFFRIQVGVFERNTLKMIPEAVSSKCILSVMGRRGASICDIVLGLHMDGEVCFPHG